MAEGVKAGSAYVEIGTDLRKLEAGLGSARQKLQGFAKNVAKIGAGITAAGGALAAPLIESIRGFAQYGDSMAKAAKRTGLTAKAMSELSYVAGLAGGDLSTVESGIRGMNMAMRMLRRGEGQAVEEFEAIGLSIKDLERLSMEDRFFAIAEAIASFADETRRGELAMTAFSRSGMMLLPMLSMGAQGIRDARMEAHMLGIALGADSASAAEELTDQMLRFKMAIQGIKNTIGMILTKPIMELSNKLLDTLILIRKWLEENPQFVEGVAKLAKWLLIVGSAIGFVGGVLAVMLSKVGLAVTGVGALGGALFLALERAGMIDSGFKQMKDSLGGLIPIGKIFAKGIVDTLKAGAKEFVVQLIEGFNLLDNLLTSVLTSFSIAFAEILRHVEVMGRPLLSDEAFVDISKSIFKENYGDMLRRQEARRKKQKELREEADLDRASASLEFWRGGRRLQAILDDYMASMGLPTGERGEGGGGSLAGGLTSAGVVGFFGGQFAGQFMGQAHGIESKQLEEARKQTGHLENIDNAVSGGALAGVYG